MLDLESLMRTSIEPIEVRKKPGFWLRCLSWLWTVKVEVVKGDDEVQLQVVAWRGKYMMDTAKVNYSFGSLHEVMKGSIESLVNDGVKTDRVLMLGYGGGSASEIIHQFHNRDAEIVGIEKDEAVLDLAKRYFYTQGVRLLHEDALGYVKRAVENTWQYELIVCDLFVDGNTVDAVVSDEFIERLSKLVSLDGGVIVNTMMKGSASKSFEAALNKVFATVRPWLGVKGNVVFLCRMGGNA